jgi:hypothetical protein
LIVQPTSVESRGVRKFRKVCGSSAVRVYYSSDPWLSNKPKNIQIGPGMREISSEHI